MLGCYDFCGYYEWTFDWLEREGGQQLLLDYWVESISNDSQRHARELIFRDGFAGMLEYWGHTLAEESPDLGYTITHRPDEVVRFDMQDCPSKGFLIRNGLEQHHDYCDHCVGWIGPMLEDAGFTLDHAHNHRAQCWWEIRRATDLTPASAPGELYAQDARLLPGWSADGATIDTWVRSTDPLGKTSQ